MPRSKGQLKVDRLEIRERELSEIVKDALSGRIYQIYGPNDLIPRRDACLVSMLWIFGKRIIENLDLQREDLWIQDNMINVRFHVRKKRGARIKDESGKTIGYHPPRPADTVRMKRKTLEHPLAHFIVDYISELKEGPNPYLYPSPRRKYNPSERKYQYSHITSVRAWQILKSLKEDIWPHWFRESSAVMHIVKGGAHVEDLLFWFDWTNPAVAMRYIQKAGGSIVDKMAKTLY